MNKQTIAIILLSLIIIGGLSYLGYQYEKTKFLNQGAFYTAQTGNLPYINQTTNQTEIMTLTQYWQGQCGNYIQQNINQICNKKQ